MKKRFLSLLLTLSFLLSTASTVFASNENKINSDKKVKLGTSYNISEIEKARSNLSEEKEVDVIITLKENGSQDFEALKTEAGKKARIAETKVLRDNFKAKLDELKVKYEIIYEYDFLFAGFAIKTAKKDLKEIKNIDGVESVEISAEFRRPQVKRRERDIREGMPLDASKAFRTVDSNNLIKLSPELQKKNNGQGRVVAVLDSGLDVNHPILRVSDVSKAMYVNEASMKSKMAEVGINYGSWRNNKVVFAHNYYSNGENVKEDSESSHGMHVSGTAVGNPEHPEKFVNPDGTNADEIIVGVSPEAQLIFMNVFNKTGNTFSHAYAKAVEDSVKLGADSVNLSLGAANGTEISVGAAMQKAIQYARKMGAIVAIAAGNDGHFGYSNSKPVATNPDYGTVGSPGVAKDALTVAAMNTTIQRSGMIKVEGIGVLKTSDVTLGSGQTENFLKGSEEQTYEYVVVPGAGEVNDFNGLELKGKVALIQRGKITFARKIINAHNKGAVGVIIYNHSTGGDVAPGMDYGDESSLVKIPAVSMGHSDGLKLSSHNDKKVTFKNALLVTPYADGGTMTDFSSYGYSTDGEFKPDITAPGGLIYSSINNGKYISMNGTSMATPHVAGAVPIVRKALIDKKAGFTGEKEYDVIKALMMSTADPVYDKGSKNYVSPRKQGAGALNVSRAISTDLYLLSEEDEPKIALRNLKSSRFDFKVKVVNFGKTSQDLKYHTVLGTDEVRNGEFQLKTRTLEKIDGQVITIPAGQTKEITISIDATKYDDDLKKLMPNGYFLEGFVIFNDSFDNGHVVSIPFSGFRGDWGKVPVWEKPIYDFGFENGAFKTDERPMYFENQRGNTVAGVNSNMTSLVTLEKNPFAFDKAWGNRYEYNLYGEYNTIPAGFDIATKSFDKNKIAFSPNGDNNKDTLVFKAVFYRNASYINAKVYKEGEKEAIFESGTAYFRKNSNTQRPDVPKSNIVLPTEFFGNDKQGNALPDGRYEYVVNAGSTVFGADEQELRFNIMLDRKAPEIKAPVVQGNLYTPDISDELSGVEAVLIHATVNGKEQWLLPNADGKIEIPVGTDQAKSLIITYDYAGNISKKYLNGADFVEPIAPQATTGVEPFFFVTDFKDKDGNLIPNTDKINMFSREGLNERVRIIDLSNNTPLQNAPFFDGKFILPPGKYKMILLNTPVFYNPVQPSEQEFEVIDGKFSKVTFTTTVKPYAIEANKGEVSINLAINGEVNPNFLNYMSYVIKDANGKEIDKDTLKGSMRVLVNPYDNNGKTDIGFRTSPFFTMEEGDYTIEVKTIDSELKLENKIIPFKVTKGNLTYVQIDSSEIYSNIFNLVINGLDKLPEGIKVTIVNKKNNEEINIRKSKFNDRAFAAYVENGTYTVKVDVPYGYKLDNNNYEITIANDKYRGVLNISKLPDIIIPTPTPDVPKPNIPNPNVPNPNAPNIQTENSKWIKEDGKWYYRNKDNKDIFNDTWAKIDNKFYRFDKNSVMLESQWIKDSGSWYYLKYNGSMASNEWIKDNGKWYFLKDNGVMKSNEWVSYKGNWYWLNESGAMAENRWILYKGEWFWAKASGKIAESEWIFVNGRWYYAKSGGYLAINTTLKIKGKSYTFNEKGEWVK